LKPQLSRSVQKTEFKGEGGKQYLEESLESYSYKFWTSVKLMKYGMDEQTVRWIESWLSGWA